MVQPVMPRPRSPIVINPVFESVDQFHALVLAGGPFPSLQRRVMQSEVEMAAITGEWVTPRMEAESAAGGERTIDVSASFRSYWMQGGHPLRDDAAWLCRHAPFVDGARAMFGRGAVVRPDEIYVNAQVPQPVRWGSCHVDIPKFRGMGRREYPVWLLTTMRRSGLFERWRIPVATAVCWFYDGPGGSYTYWPDGPDAPPVQTQHPFTNTAVMGENDTMFHRGDGAGAIGVRGPAGMTLDCELAPLANDSTKWTIRNGDVEVARYDAAEIRLALSWSAEVYVDDDAAREADEHVDDLDINTVLERFLDDLRARGLATELPADPLHDIGFIATLARAYRVVPKEFPSAEETELVRRREAAILT